MQDLPITPDALITPEQRELMRSYCVNDLDTTQMLYQALEKQVALRTKMSEQYGMDLRSKSDAQIAETVIKSELAKIAGYEFRGKNIIKKPIVVEPVFSAANDAAKQYAAAGYSYADAHMKAADDFNVCPSELGSIRAKLKTHRNKKEAFDENSKFKYLDPKIVSFNCEQLNGVFARILKTRFELGANGAVKMPDWLKATKIKLGQSEYQMGIGGLHSCEKSQYIAADDETLLFELDVASYYPNIILQQRLAPKSLGEPFLKVYQSIVERRMAAKKKGDKVTADTLKIAVNGSFGKLGSKYSALYAPDLLIQTTITGQLALLMLIERMESIGVSVRSANTDGIVCQCPKRLESEMQQVAFEWMLDTSYELERTDYKAVASRDVNSYVAVKLDGGTKGKGCFASSGLAKNPDLPIVYTAVAKRIADGTPVEHTIKRCSDITQFVTVRRVTGGAVWREQALGKAIRFYYSRETASDECIHYAKNSNRVPKSAGAKPLMGLPDTFPSDVNYNAYIVEAEKLLCEVGYA
jgi:hypothetical protein